MSQSQRQSATIHSQTNEYFSGIKGGNQKKKIIKKERPVCENPSSNKLTKEQRMRIQKQKNRQAAQRSRDQHKQYVNNLQMEVKYLKEQIQINKNICFKCKQELTINHLDSQEKQENLFQQEIFLNLQPQQPSQDSHSHIIPQNQDMAQYFLRPKEEQEEDYSYIKMMLFVAMVVLVVMVFPTDSKLTEKSRNLVEIYKTPQSVSIIKDEFNMVSSDDQKPNQYNSLSPSSGLVIRNELINQQCLNSLFDQRSYSLTNLRTSQITYDSQHNQGILLCSFQQPTKLTNSNSIGKNSQFLRLFMVGAQIKQMVGLKSPISRFLHNKLQLNGIYRIGAQIKEVELISQHNCLL